MSPQKLADRENNLDEMSTTAERASQEVAPDVAALMASLVGLMASPYSDKAIKYFSRLQQCEEIRLAFQHPENLSRSVKGAAGILNRSRETVHKKMAELGLRKMDFQIAKSLLELIEKSDVLLRAEGELHEILRDTEVPCQARVVQAAPLPRRS